MMCSCCCTCMPDLATEEEILMLHRQHMEFIPFSMAWCILSADFENTVTSRNPVTFTSSLARFCSSSKLRRYLFSALFGTGPITRPILWKIFLKTLNNPMFLSCFTSATCKENSYKNSAKKWGTTETAAGFLDVPPDCGNTLRCCTWLRRRHRPGRSYSPAGISVAIAGALHVDRSIRWTAGSFANFVLFGSFPPDDSQRHNSLSIYLHTPVEIFPVVPHHNTEIDAHHGI